MVAALFRRSTETVLLAALQGERQWLQKATLAWSSGLLRGQATGVGREGGGFGGGGSRESDAVGNGRRGSGDGGVANRQSQGRAGEAKSESSSKRDRKQKGCGIVDGKNKIPCEGTSESQRHTPEKEKQGAEREPANLPVIGFRNNATAVPEAKGGGGGRRRGRVAAKISKAGAPREDKRRKDRRHEKRADGTTGRRFQLLVSKTRSRQRLAEKRAGGWRGGGLGEGVQQETGVRVCAAEERKWATPADDLDGDDDAENEERRGKTEEQQTRMLWAKKKGKQHGQDVQTGRKERGIAQERTTGESAPS